MRVSIVFNMREKKSWKKAIDQTEIIEGLEARNDQKDRERKIGGLKNDDLFKVNVDKSSLKTKRDKLKKDRFKEKQRATTSKVEEELVKRLVET